MKEAENLHYKVRNMHLVDFDFDYLTIVDYELDIRFSQQ